MLIVKLVYKTFKLMYSLPEKVYKHTCDTIYAHFQGITNNIYGFGRPFFAPSFCYPSTHISTRDRASTIQMYSSTSTITLNMHEYEYSENKCTRVRVQLLYNVLEYDYFRK